VQRAVGSPADVPVTGAQRSLVLDLVGRGGGRRLEDRVRRQMESAFGTDFSDVRIHTGPEASRSAASVQARAYTVGSEIAFGDSEYAPGTTDGNHRLAHELAHVVQQRQGPVDGIPRVGGIAVSSPSDRFERAATAEADRVMANLARTTSESAGAEPVARPGPRGSALVTVQRTEESAEVLTELATPQVGEGPAVEVQKDLVVKLEQRLGEIIAADAETQRKNVEDTAAWQVRHDAWAKGWKWLRGAEPQAPPRAFGGGGGNRPQVTAEGAVEFNLGGILLDSLPEYKRKDVAGFYQGLAKEAKLIPLDQRVPGARSSGMALPELVAGFGNLVIENTLKTMIDASQFKYLRAVGLPNDEWKILIEVHYMRSRPKDMSGFHKDTQGQTIFVNLNYHAGENALRGPEYVLNPPASAKHDERIFGTVGKSATLPKEFTDDLRATRGKLAEPTEIRSSGTVQPYGYVAFVDEAIHHATPFFEHRYVTPKEFKAYLERTDKNKLDEIMRVGGNAGDVNDSIIAASDVAKWSTWREMIGRAGADVRYTREHFARTMGPGEFDRMLENVGSQPGAQRLHGGAGGWYAASIANDGNPQIHAGDRPPLVRQASNAQLTANWPAQLPPETPRRFFRTWVRAVPEAMAARLRALT
jgi:hypothetical protein